MTFTKTHPTTPGFYAWRRSEAFSGYAVTVALDPETENELVVIGKWEAEPLPREGEWCRLVPSEEVEEAFREGWNKRAEITGALPNMPWINNKWNNSRAKRVAEGME